MLHLWNWDGSLVSTPKKLCDHSISSNTSKTPLQNLFIIWGCNGRQTGHTWIHSFVLNDIHEFSCGKIPKEKGANCGANSETLLFVFGLRAKEIGRTTTKFKFSIGA